MSGKTEMSNFISTINSIREILRSPEGITGMDSVNHCVAFYLVRRLDVDLCGKMNIDSKFAFENFDKDEDGEELDEQKLMEKFYVRGGKDCFVNVLVNKFKFTAMKQFSIKSPIALQRIFGLLKKIDIDIEKEIDVVGIIYETHLSTGSTGSGMRDLGQYFTSRKVIDYMVKLCDPKVVGGKIETILDPTMGTGGFLTMSAKYINKKGKVDWKRNQSRMFGFDISENVRSLAYINLLLETGFEFTNLIQRDTLSNDFAVDDVPIDKVDIILANEPFGLKNIKYADCCKRIKDLKINGTKAEPLFLQLMMLSLNEGGRCAVIVPDGVLFNDANLHKDTRKYLVENFNLRKVIGMKGDFFLNTGVKASILFFENTGETREVEFCEIVLKDGQIDETVLKVVKGEEVVGKGCSLSANKYLENKEYKFTCVEYKSLGDICEFKGGKQLSKECFLDGQYPVIGGGQQPTGFHDKFNRPENTILCSSSGAYAGFISKYHSPVWASDCFSLHPVQKLNNNYLYYYLKNIQEKIYDYQSGSAQPHVYPKSIEDVEIPIPSLEIQQQLVDVLDNQYSIIKANKELIKMYEKQKASYVWSNTLNIETKTLGDICEVTQGTYITHEMKIKGEYPVYGGGDTNFWINQYNREDEIIIAKDGVSIDCVRYEPSKFFLSHHAWTLTCKNICKKYLFYYLYEHRNALYNIATGSAQKGINQKNFYAMTISIPSIDIQKRIVEKCEYYDSIIARLKTEIRELEETDIISQVLSSVTSGSESERDSASVLIDAQPEVCQSKLRGKSGEVCGKPCVGDTGKCKTHKPKSPAKK